MNMLFTYMSPTAAYKLPSYFNDTTIHFSNIFDSHYVLTSVADTEYSVALFDKKSRILNPSQSSSYNLTDLAFTF